jgi:general nucleoside transport system ATP-binding protein
MTYKVEMNNITKTFGMLVANDKVNLQVKKGEVHALLGENGAGKSTLMSILFGLYQPDLGEILIDGKPVKIDNPNIANELGIGMVHQHFKLVEAFTVLENIVLGYEDTKRGVLKFDDARKKIQNIIDTYHLHVDLDSKISDISVGMQQRVEILKMLYRNSDILIFDEPTAVLTPQEISQLIKIIKNFAKEGKTIIIITHKLNEIKSVADRCTVLRRGEMVGVVDVAKTSTDKLAEMMVGRQITFKVEKSDNTVGEVIFEAKDLVVELEHKKIVNHVSFNVRQGEIVGIAGIDGNGQTELVQAISGLRSLNNGQVLLHHKDITNLKIRSKYEQGLSHIPEDRQRHGLVLDFDLANNLIIQNYYQIEFQKRGFLNFENIYKHADELIERFDIRSEKGAKTHMRSMSGGNQQKAIIAREVSRKHDFLIAVQPTRGLDVGAIEYIHKQLINERNQGKGILLVSLELDEIMDLSDRILVMFEGEIVKEFSDKEATINEIGLYMSGSKKVKNDEVNE